MGRPPHRDTLDDVILLVWFVGLILLLIYWD